MLYHFTQSLIHRKAYWAETKRFIDQGLPHREVLDVGCGTGLGRKLFNESVQYLGVDIDSKRILEARKSSRTSQTEFQVIHDLSSLSKFNHSTILAKGVLHHLSNDQVVDLINVLRSENFQSRRFIAIEPVLHKSNNVFENTIMRFDRGAFIRTEDQYLHFFDKARTRYKITHRILRIPYSFIFIEAELAGTGK